jgi:hypothetical protein
MISNNNIKIIILLYIILILLIVLIINSHQKINETYRGLPFLSFDKKNPYTRIPIKLLKDIPEIILRPYKLFSGFEDPYNLPTTDVINYLIQYGNYRVIGLQICRAPIPYIISNLFNFVTTGKFNQVLKIKGMDDIFHTWLNITLTNDKEILTIKTEKNSIIEFSDKDLIAKNCFTIKGIPKNNKLTLLKLFQNAIEIHPFDFYLYDGRNNNCQEYVRSLLKGSDYLSDEANTFLYQNAQDIFDNLGYTGELVGNFIRNLSNLAANATKYLYD